MSRFLYTIKNRFYYSVSSVKNRYPCKIIGVKLPDEAGKASAKITYRAVTKFNIVETLTKNIIDDPVLIEKFHTMEGVKLGFLSAGEILFSKEIKSLEDAKALYRNIANKMFESKTEP